MKKIIIYLLIALGIFAEEVDFKLSIFDVDKDLKVEKFRLNVIYGEHKSFDGIDVTLLSSSIKENSRGLKIGGLYNKFEGDFEGVSLFHLMDEIYGTFKGVKVGVINLDKNTRAFRFGVLNLSEEMNGVDFGSVNFSKKVHGIQIGIFNYAEELDGYQLGLANFAKNSILPVTLLFNYAKVK